MGSNTRFFSTLFGIMFMFLCYIGAAYSADYWVSKTGSNNNGCTSSADACSSIQKAISLAGPGDTVNITSGTYVEDSSNSPYTSKCTFVDSFYASLCAIKSGTASSPITIQAAPGDEGKVTLDSQLARVGILLKYESYIHIRGIRFINNLIIGIASWGQVPNAVPDPARMSTGVVVDNCYIFNTGGPYGYNISGIGMWSSKDWVVKNNTIDTVYTFNDPRDESAIQAYGVVNALIENNYFTNVGFGIFWKDHFVQDATTRAPFFESEIRYNRMNVKTYGVQLGIRGSNTTEAGKNYIHHNIIYGFSGAGAGIRAAMAGAYGISADIRIEHNMIDGGGGSSTKCISLDANKTAEIKGNILTRCGQDIELVRYSDTKIVNLVYSDYNVFDQSFSIIADRYSSNSKSFSSLSSWQSMSSSGLLSLGVNNPDMHSKTTAFSDLFVSGNSDYKYLSNSVANKLMPDGSNAGPYQNGAEVIGGVRPNAPTIMQAAIN